MPSSACVTLQVLRARGIIASELEREVRNARDHHDDGNQRADATCVKQALTHGGVSADACRVRTPPLTSVMAWSLPQRGSCILVEPRWRPSILRLSSLLAQLLPSAVIASVVVIAAIVFRPSPVSRA
jgi:hypothetical protein